LRYRVKRQGRAREKRRKTSAWEQEMDVWWVLNSASCIRIPNSRQGKQFPLALRHCKFQLDTRTYRDKYQKARIIDSQVGYLFER
jgi:hypothetical protein